MLVLFWFWNKVKKPKPNIFWWLAMIVFQDIYMIISVIHFLFIRYGSGIEQDKIGCKRLVKKEKEIRVFLMWHLSFNHFISGLKAELNKTEVVSATTTSDLRGIKINIEKLIDWLLIWDLTIIASILAITPPKPVSGPMPTSCANYKTMGHTQNGFYLVTGSSNKVKTVYCDFSQKYGTAGITRYTSGDFAN